MSRDDAEQKTLPPTKRKLKKARERMEEVTLGVVRDGDEREVTVTLGATG